MRVISAFIATAIIGASASAQEIDWKKIDDALGRTAAVTGDVHRYGFPRSDLQVSLEGVTIKPALALGGWVAFKPAHACLYGRLGNADDLGHFFHRLLVVVDEIDDLPMFSRKPGQALPQGQAFIFLREGDFGRVGLILDLPGRLVVKFFLRSAAQGRQRFEPRDAQHPWR